MANCSKRHKGDSLKLRYSDQDNKRPQNQFQSRSSKVLLDLSQRSALFPYLIQILNERLQVRIGTATSGRVPRSARYHFRRQED